MYDAPDKIPYHPHFNPIKIDYPTIIGGVTDYSPFYKLAQSRIFRFYLSDRFNHQYQQIPNNQLIEYIRHAGFDLMLIEGLVSYNNEQFGVKIQVDSDTLKNDESQIESMLYILNKLIIQLKLGMYEKHPAKQELDAINTHMHTMIHSVNVGGYGTEFDYLRERLSQLSHQVEKDLERIIMDNYAQDKFRTVNPFAKSDSDFIIEKPIVEESMKPTKSEEEEFADIDKYLTDASKTLKLNLRAIRTLHKAKSDKFVLPLYASDPKDVVKFTDLTEKPFNFLSYNGAMFSCDLISSLRETWLDTADQSMWQSLWNERIHNYTKVKRDINVKRDNIATRQKKLGKVYNKLGKQIDAMKEQFIQRSEKYKNPKILRFMAGRTESNIKTIRAAERLAKRKIDILQSKKLTSRPIMFFERAVTLYLGKTGEDIIQDLFTLGYTSMEDHKLAIEYLFFLLRLIEERTDKFTSPVLPILSDKEFEFGFEKPEILKVLAGHMFIHTVTLSKKQPKVREIVKKPIPPKPRMVKE